MEVLRTDCLLHQPRALSSLSDIPDRLCPGPPQPTGGSLYVNESKKKLIFDLTLLPFDLPTSGQPIFNNTNNEAVSLLVNDVASLSSTFQDFLNLSGISVVDNMATVSGPLVCGNGTVRDELAMAMADLVGTEDNGTFASGAVQCGVCGKTDSWNSFSYHFSALVVITVCVYREPNTHFLHLCCRGDHHSDCYHTTGNGTLSVFEAQQHPGVHQGPSQLDRSGPLCLLNSLCLCLLLRLPLSSRVAVGGGCGRHLFGVDRSHTLPQEDPPHR